MADRGQVNNKANSVSNIASRLMSVCPKTAISGWKTLVEQESVVKIVRFNDDAI